MIYCIWGLLIDWPSIAGSTPTKGNSYHYSLQTKAMLDLSIFSKNLKLLIFCKIYVYVLQKYKVKTSRIFVENQQSTYKKQFREQVKNVLKVWLTAWNSNPPWHRTIARRKLIKRTMKMVIFWIFLESRKLHIIGCQFL